MKFYDVSMMIKEKMMVYPGNPTPSIRQYSSIPKDKVNESLLFLGSHTGTHVDSKLHIQNNVEDAGSLPLASFYGKCKVLDLTHVKKEIHKKDIANNNLENEDIILLKTRNSELGYKRFRKSFVHLKFDAAEYIVKAGVKTLGFDYLSVKKFGDDEEVHRILIENLTLFEGLDLGEVSPGEYIFLGLPLRINSEGAPARVILVED